MELILKVLQGTWPYRQICMIISLKTNEQKKKWLFFLSLNWHREPVTLDVLMTFNSTLASLCSCFSCLPSSADPSMSSDSAANKEIKESFRSHSEEDIQTHIYLFLFLVLSIKHKFNTIDWTDLCDIYTKTVHRQYIDLTSITVDFCKYLLTLRNDTKNTFQTSCDRRNNRLWKLRNSLKASHWLVPCVNRFTDDRR